ncbi:hypothetical protein [Spiroplasma endosymbiont of Cantharis lateralis]|uniref:hypothetical protein n=1 Tax=Spiroplasma endosymbiont of Cantharis lateralis TaxID=3066277 RepID=UPI00313D6B30
MNKENITRKDYKMFCLIVKDFWFKKDIQSLLDIVAKILFLNKRKTEIWELYKDYNIANKLERNQFAVLTHICKETNFNDISKEIRIISFRYKSSYESRKTQFKDD